MRFKLYTPVDITCTSARKGEDTKKYLQQQNYLTVLNTIGLRVNPIVEKIPYIENKSFFGKKYKTWVFEFSIDYGATSIDLLKTDFQLVPFVTNLDEEAKFEECVFITEGKKLNIIFEQVDK